MEFLGEAFDLQSKLNRIMTRMIMNLDFSFLAGLLIVFLVSYPTIDNLSICKDATGELCSTGLGYWLQRVACTHRMQSPHAVIAEAYGYVTQYP